MEIARLARSSPRFERPRPIGPTASATSFPVVAANARGDLALVWRGRGGRLWLALGARGRLARGRPLGGRTKSRPAVALAPDGRVVVAWLKPRGKHWALRLLSETRRRSSRSSATVFLGRALGYLGVAAGPDGRAAVAWLVPRASGLRLLVATRTNAHDWSPARVLPEPRANQTGRGSGRVLSRTHLAPRTGIALTP